MIYLVQTKYKLGIFTSKKKAEVLCKNFHYYIRTFVSCNELRQWIRENQENWDFEFPLESFEYNRFYKIFEDRLYAVVYNSYRAGFVKTENMLEFVRKNRFIRYSFRGNFTYAQAVQKVWSLGIVVPGNKIMSQNNPVCGFVYKRR